MRGPRESEHSTTGRGTRSPERWAAAAAGRHVRKVYIKILEASLPLHTRSSHSCCTTKKLKIHARPTS